MGIVVQARGRSGEVLARDTRPDGTVVILVCKQWDSPIGNGVVVGPGEPAKEDKTLLGEFPLFGVHAEEKPFRIVIDTTGLPAGPMHFRSERFLEAASEAASEGATEVVLSRHNAEFWGLISEPRGA